jgi:hypothetical protein
LNGCVDVTQAHHLAERYDRHHRMNLRPAPVRLAATRQRGLAGNYPRAMKRIK